MTSWVAPVQPRGVFADRSEQAVAHLVHHALGTSSVLLVSACTQIVRRQGCQPIGLFRDVRVPTAQSRRQEAYALQAVVVRYRSCIAQQLLHFVA